MLQEQPQKEHRHTKELRLGIKNPKMVKRSKENKPVIKENPQ